MTAAERWLDAVWPLARDWLPAPPARLVELGCGPLGGLVPRLRAAGYDAIGVDPEAPDGVDYRRIPFESFRPSWEADGLIASTSLHHVADPALVVDCIARVLAPGGSLVVVEWDWERFDQSTARWVFERLGAGDGWLHRLRDDWLDSGRPWLAVLREWAGREQVHPAATLIRVLDERFEREHVASGPYFFADLAETSEQQEQAAIEAGEIQATRVDYIGRLR